MSDLFIGYDEFERLAAGILKDGRRLRFTAHGDSMRPFILDGDTLELQPILPGGLKRGDVALCRLGDGRLVVHRLMQVNPESILIQGDALPYSDGYLPRASVLGRVYTLIRRGNRIHLDGFWMAIVVKIWLYLTPLRTRMLRTVMRLRRKLHPKSD